MIEPTTTTREGARGDPGKPAQQPGQLVTRLEAVFFRVCVGLIALHVVDDRFLQPEEGISAADHLVSGGVPLLVLVLAAVFYPRLRAGRRALTALVLAAFGFATGAEAVYYTREVGASGDDFTSWLTIPAALGLLGLYAVVLWRSRKRTGSMLWRIVRRSLLGLGTLALVYVLLLPMVQTYVVTHVVNAKVPEPEFGVAYEDVSFTTGDGLQLDGWYVPSENGAAVIVFPGRTDRDDYVRMLADHGYGVLVFDRRGEGDSDGEPNLLGWGGDEDLKAAADYLQSRSDVEPERIGGIGLSVGGELLVEAAAESDDFRAVVSEGAGTRSIRETIDRPGSPAFFDALSWSLGTAYTAVFADQMPPPSIQELLPDVSPAALLLIYGERGQPQEIAMNPEFFEAAQQPKQLWEVPDAGHIGALDAQPEEYEERVVGFFDETLLGR
jgi:pimeloyl-ACP methyl ester carboxylesterase